MEDQQRIGAKATLLLVFCLEIWRTGKCRKWRFEEFGTGHSCRFKRHHFHNITDVCLGLRFRSDRLRSSTMWRLK